MDEVCVCMYMYMCSCGSQIIVEFRDFLSFKYDCVASSLLLIFILLTFQVVEQKNKGNFPSPLTV